MAYTEIATSLIRSGKEFLSDIADLLRSNFADHESRLVLLETNPVFQIVPSGIILPFAGAVAPTGYLLTDGSTVSRTTYAALFAILGTTFNTGGEAGTDFRLPDPRGRVLIGAGTGSGLTARTLAQTVGTETVTLASGEIPTHTHVVNDSGHTHTWPRAGATGGTNGFSDKDGLTYTNKYTDFSLTGISIANTGGSGSHNNIQPSFVTGYVIKT